MAIHGRNIIIKMGGVAIAGTRSHDVQTKSDKIEVSSPTTGKWRHYIAGRKEWSVTVNYLVLANSGIKDLLKVGTMVELVIQDRDGDESLTGQAFLETCKQTYTLGNLVQGTFQFVGNGELK